MAERPLIDAPDWFQPEAREEWRKIVGAMAARGLLSDLNLSHLQGFAVNRGRWLKAEAEISKYGEVVKKPGSDLPAVNPWVEVGDRALRRWREFAADLKLVELKDGRIMPRDAGLGDDDIAGFFDGVDLDQAH